MNLLFWPSIQYKAPFFLRMAWPAHELAKRGYNVKIKDPRMLHKWNTEEQMAADFLWADLVMAFYPKDRSGPHLAELCDRFNKTFIVDADDYGLAVDPTNPAYGFWGVKDVYVRNKPVWMDGIQYDSEITTANHNRWLDVLAQTDVLTTTTPTLAKFYAPFTSDTWLLPNSLNLDCYKSWERRASEDVVRVGWQGGASHYRDMMMIVPALRELKAQHGDKIQLVMMGQFWRNIVDDTELGIEFHPWVDSDTYPLKLGSLDLDIGLCPIEDNIFSKGKSNLKQVEYGAFSVPSVCSFIPDGPYSTPEGITEHGVDGLLAKNTPEDWVDKINILISDSGLRKDMGAKYRKKVETLFNIKETWVEWRNCYETIANGRILGATG